MQICETIQIFQIINDGNVVELRVCCLFPPSFNHLNFCLKEIKVLEGLEEGADKCTVRLKMYGPLLHISLNVLITFRPLFYRDKNTITVQSSPEGYGWAINRLKSNEKI